VYRNELRAMLEAKLAGQEIARPEPAPEAPVVDLMEALKQSVARAQKGKDKPAAAKPKKASTGRKRAAAR
jgi:DNA end-binding protein Ku